MSSDSSISRPLLPRTRPARRNWSAASGCSLIAVCRATLAQAYDARSGGSARSQRSASSAGGRRRCRSRPGAPAPASSARRRCASRCRPSSPGSGPGCRRSRRRRAAGASEIRPAAWRAARGLFASMLSAHLLPDVGRRRAASRRRASRRGRRSRRRRPSAPARRRCAASRTSLPASCVVGEREAGDLAVVVHAKARELGGEGGAVAAPHRARAASRCAAGPRRRCRSSAARRRRTRAAGPR